MYCILYLLRKPGICVGEGGILTDIDWAGRGFFLLMKFEDFSSPGLLTVWEVPKGFLDTNGHYDYILFSE